MGKLILDRDWLNSQIDNCNKALDVLFEKRQEPEADIEAIDRRLTLLGHEALVLNEVKSNTKSLFSKEDCRIVIGFMLYDTHMYGFLNEKGMEMINKRNFSEEFISELCDTLSMCVNDILEEGKVIG